ncbi:carboxypeptidase-like regulatory domain-containing protein [uncultured Hymenobacter sp.]|uniref:carboxypeptidase-like regulatory domain-containing protein n=1 Tax=uncultured Hymenobacter sp. TaxID=170016 RepID=UPI0035C9CFEF
MISILSHFCTPRPHWLSALLLALLAGLSARPAQAQQTMRVSGTVSAADTRQPIPGATVQIQRLRRGVAASGQGEFSVEALSTDTLQFRAVGYKPRRLLLGGSGLSQLVLQVVLVRDSVQLGEVRVTSDRPDRAAINRALRNLRKPPPPKVSQVKRPPKPKPLFPSDSAAPKAPVATLENPVSLLYDQFSRAGKERRKMEAIQAQQAAEKARQARAKYNRVFKDNRGYE